MGHKTIGFIGCGNMGAAIVRGLSANNEGGDFSILINDTDAKKTSSLSELTHSKAVDLDTLVTSSDILIVAIKPQDSEELFNAIKHNLSYDNLMISVMAGVKISSILKSIGIDIPIVRAMPNMPGVIGAGITCFSCNDLVTCKDIILNIFNGIGAVLEVEEAEMDIITAISGSGPAYFFYFADALIKASVSNGLSLDVAKELVLQTFLGSAKLLAKSVLSPEDLVASVASKGGTTEAALSVFNNKKMDQIIISAVDKARQRSSELSKG